MYRLIRLRLIWLSILLLSLVACQLVRLLGPTATPTPTFTPVPTLTPTLTPTPPPSPTPTNIPTPTTSPAELRVGDWSGTSDIGTLSFTVLPGGKEITNLVFSYQVGGVSTEIELTSGSIPISADGSFQFHIATFDFQGQFSEDGTSASGTYEVEPPLHDAVSGEWTAEKK